MGFAYALNPFLPFNCRRKFYCLPHFADELLVYWSLQFPYSLFNYNIFLFQHINVFNLLIEITEQILHTSKENR